MNCVGNTWRGSNSSWCRFSLLVNEDDLRAIGANSAECRPTTAVVGIELLSQLWPG
jgi:hypothetical protein